MLPNPYMNPFINQFPYMDTHEMNLDWIIKTCKLILQKMEGFEAANTVEYKGVWSITSQYTKWSIVIDTETGYLMIAKQPVPSGIDINNTNYWMIASPFKIDTSFNSNSYNAIANKTVTTKFSLIDTDILGLKDADIHLSDRITQETSDRAATDNTINERISTEISDRENADTGLSSRITTNANAISTENNKYTWKYNIQKCSDEAYIEIGYSRVSIVLKIIIVILIISIAWVVIYFLKRSE